MMVMFWAKMWVGTWCTTFVFVIYKTMKNCVNISSWSECANRQRIDSVDNHTNSG